MRSSIITQIALCASALLLGACSHRAAPVVSPQVTPATPVPIVEAPKDPWTFENRSDMVTIDPAIVGPALGRAKAAILRVRGVEAKVPQFGVVMVPTDYVNAAGGKFFFFDRYVVPEMIGFLKLSLPSSILNGHVLGAGITDTWTIPPMVYVLAEHPDVSTTLAHEFVHLLWFSTWPDEMCANGFPVWANTYHSNSCDPFSLP